MSQCYEIVEHRVGNYAINEELKYVAKSIAIK